MVMHDDWLLRQINRFAQGVAELVAGETVAEDEDIEEECEALLGAPIDSFEQMSVHSLLSLFPTHDAATERRCVALAVALARRAATDPERAEGVRRRALALLDAMHDSGRELTEEVTALRRSLILTLGGATN